MDTMKRNRLGMVLALSAAAALAAETAMAESKKVPLPRPRPALQAAPLAQAAKGLAAKGLAAKGLAAKGLAAKELAAPALPSKKRLPAAGLSAFAQANVGVRGAMFATRATFRPLVRPASASRSREAANASCSTFASVALSPNASVSARWAQGNAPSAPRDESSATRASGTRRQNAG